MSEQYRQKLRRRARLELAVAALGFAAYFAITFFRASGIWPDFSLSFAWGMLGSLCSAFLFVQGLFRYIRDRRLLKNAVRAKTAEIEEYDERERLIALRGDRIALWVTAVLLALAMVVLLILKELTAFWVCFALLAVLYLTQTFARIWLQKKL